MKILKPGKVEMRMFVCPSCGCIFIASDTDLEHDGYGKWAICPQEGCERNFIVHPDDGEPYKEPTPTQTDSERLARILFAMPAMDDCNSMADYLIQHGVTFREV